MSLKRWRQGWVEFNELASDLKEKNELQSLAIYNSEVARGIVHTPEWKAQMKKLQDAFNKQRLERDSQ